MASLVKVCSTCGKKKPIGSFYTNKLNKSQNCRDFWCRECVSKDVFDKASLQEYCSENQRVFSEMLWQDCEEKIRVKYNDEAEYNGLSEEKREEFSNQKILNGYYSRQNQVQYYTFIPKNEDTEKLEEIINPDNMEQGASEEPTRSDKKKYSTKWGGDFTEEELVYLEEQYKKAQEDYNLKTTNDLEYAQNVAVSGLIVRKTRKDYLNGEPGADKRYKESVAIYDSLCTSAKFNQKTRSENAETGLGSFGETWKRLEEMGFETVQVTFPKDDVDIILEEYAHSHVALRGALDDVE